MPTKTRDIRPLTIEQLHCLKVENCDRSTHIFAVARVKVAVHNIQKTPIRMHGQANRPVNAIGSWEWIFVSGLTPAKAKAKGGDHTESYFSNTILSQHQDPGVPQGIITPMALGASTKRVTRDAAEVFSAG